MSAQFLRPLLCVSILVLLPLRSSLAQEAKADAKPPALPKIADEPKTVDPTTLIAPKLAVAATADFSNSSLREVVAWLREKHKLVVLVDESALSDIGVSPAEPISDRLTNDPIYLMLNRLRSMQLDWYFDDNVLYITSVENAEQRATTLPHNVGDLLDAGYKLEDLQDVITSTVAVDSWEDVGGSGILSSLGDVLFVRQNAARQRDVNALLQALRKHGRQTFVNDPQQHLELRQRLSEDVTVEFLDTPLESAIEQLAKSAKIDIRLDIPALRSIRVREREPITLKLADRKLATVLQAIVLDLKLTWVLRDGVLRITTPDEAESFLKTAVYDVRDLCRDANESDALIEAIVSQTNPDSWDEVGGPGSVAIAKSGTLVVTHQERAHAELLNLLETYRTALRASKPRTRDETDPKKIITVYYRVHANMAKDLSVLLPSLVPADNWKTNAKPEGAGDIFVVASTPDLSPLATLDTQSKQEKRAVVTERAVLIVRQTRELHDKIQTVLNRIESGDHQATGGMGGMGGGGFGGGFFSIPARPVSRRPSK